jgi:cell filamentation protein
MVVGTEWESLDRESFAARAAAVFALLNQAHPFREGNGRMSKVFMEQVAERSRFTLDFTRVTPE